MSKSPGYSKYNALLDSENSETESDIKKPGIYSLSNNAHYQEKSALIQLHKETNVLMQLQKEEEQQIIERARVEAVKKITDDEIKEECAESGFFNLLLSYLFHKFK